MPYDRRSQMAPASRTRAEKRAAPDRAAATPASASAGAAGHRFATLSPTSPGHAPVQRGKQAKLSTSDAYRKFLMKPRLVGIKKPTRRAKFQLGSHGAKKREQARLKQLFGVKVTGSTHESEHTIGYEVLGRTSGLKRGKGARARSLENFAPAYQEVKSLHRQHIGTGNRGYSDASGFNAQGYRDTQRQLLEDGHVGDAIQINQLGYAHDPNFSSTVLSTDKGKVANTSFDTMLDHLDSVTYAKNQKDVTVPVDAKQKAEAWLSRRVAALKRFPTRQEENLARHHFGLKLLSDD